MLCIGIKEYRGIPSAVALAVTRLLSVVFAAIALSVFPLTVVVVEAARR